MFYFICVYVKGIIEYTICCRQLLSAFPALSAIAHLNNNFC